MMQVCMMYFGTYLPQTEVEVSEYVHEREFPGIKVRGLSVAGISTCLYLPDLSACLDIAQGLAFALSAKNFFITHAHQDHMGGIAYIVSQRALNKLPPAVFYLPESVIEPVRQLMQIWEKLEGHEYEFELRTLKPGEPSIPLKNGFSIESFPTVHRVASQGYQLFQETKKLKKEFFGLPGDEIKALRSKGVAIADLHNDPVFAFTGDTKVEVFERNPKLLQTRTVFVECTYYDERKSVESAREWGHIHLDELRPTIEAFQGERFVLIHPSRKYRPHEIWPIVEKRLGPRLCEKVDLFCGQPNFGNPLYIKS
jgi:ribonuclease Z